MRGGQRAQWQMNNFRAAADECGLVDVRYEGYAFTWDNGQAGEDNRQSRIDRAMGNNEWLEKFPYARLRHLEREWSDHSPLKLVLDMRDSVGQQTKRFRFEQIWVGAEGCEDAVLRGFERGSIDLVEALNESAKELQAWKSVSIGKIVKSIASKRSQIARLNEGGRSMEEVRKRPKLVKEVADLYRQEEQFWRQRSHALWLKDGDKNTSFFHKQAGQRKAKNYISKLVDDGAWLGVGMKLEEEVLEALNQMHPLKAPGPDGMNGLFYQTYWHIVGPLNSRHKEGHMAVKLDMAKAYDRVEWDFLEQLLRVMGFHGEWVDRVMTCVTTVSSAVLINGNVKDVFQPARGLRQGDPLSPYLFILCAEVLSNLMRRAIVAGSLHGLRVSSSAPVISHLLFADDSIFFIKASEEEATEVSNILGRYELASGQKVNLDKTTVSFSRGVSDERKSRIAARLGVNIVEEQERYLGLPTVLGRSKKPITDIVRNN
ncbi:uncharacterized protein LOC141648659 [Silene latifolia]|uniref:uncharacterized protein LOC141648659 n=1 Tax=Silene latifolia TaxID=37657 RepID=UPI003D789B15